MKTISRISQPAPAGGAGVKSRENRKLGVIPTQLSMAIKRSEVNSVGVALNLQDTYETKKGENRGPKSQI